jgi:glutathione synthase/RimK-type ligase-like ATP-grasp enzyme
MSAVVLGILTHRSPSDEGPFGGHSPLVQRVTLLAQREGVRVVAFDPADLFLTAGRVRASVYLGEPFGWANETLPLPDVIWSRYFKLDHDAVFDPLQRLGIPLLNETLLNKWEAHQCLVAAGDRLAVHLPHTEPLSDARRLVDLLGSYPTMFIKPVDGAVGRGIIRAGLEPSGLIRLCYLSTESGILRDSFATPEQLDRWFSHENRTERYIAQAGIDLITMGGRPTDVRILVQKDGLGSWRLTGMGARVAAPGRFTANLHTGGTGMPVPEVLSASFPSDPDRVQAISGRLGDLSLAIALKIERRAGSMGELGLDFGIDTQGKIWFIEQNARPGRAIFEHLGNWDLVDLAHLRPAQYARYLATEKSAKTAGYGAT